MKLHWEPLNTTETPTLIINDEAVLTDLSTWEDAVNGIQRLWAQGYAGWSWNGFVPQPAWKLALLTAQERATLNTLMEAYNGI